jgi:crotonobetainyl-CoA:carnitine CoA-transferase CaiB-like acyl-CoA transferase
VPCGNESICRQPAMPIKISGFEPEYKWAGGVLGRDNESVLASLGYTEKEIKELKALGLFGTET